MTWVRFTDQTARRQVIRAAGKDGRELFYAAAFECAAMDDGAGGEGLLSALLVKDAAYLAEVNARRTAPRLVELGLWHDHESADLCADCSTHGSVPPLKPGDYFLHEWWEFLLIEDEVGRWRQRRRKALNNDHDLKAAVRKRDRDRCRYCGTAVIFGTADRKSKRVGEFDHVDPWSKAGRGGYGNTVENVVAACKPCNGRKRNRTPEEADMPLLPVPSGIDLTLGTPGSGRDPVGGQISAGSEAGSAGSDQADRRGSPRDGNGPDRGRKSAGSAARSGRGRSGSGSARGRGPFEDDAA